MNKTVASLLIFLKLIVALSACSGPFCFSCTNPASPLVMTVSISPEPIVGRDVTYRVEITALKSNLPNTALTITLSSGIDLIQGDLSWHGDVAEGQTVTKDLIIRVTTPGEWSIYAYAASQPNLAQGGTALFGASKTLYLKSSTDSAQVIEGIP